MQIIIPMTGIGKRFLEAGYSDPKPLLEIEGKAIIEHVIALFPGEKDFIFIVNEDHASTTNVVKIIQSVVADATIVLAPKGQGPVEAVLQARDHIKDSESCLVNYCDFGMQWDYQLFKHTVETNQCDGAIPSYIGFHPHLLHDNKYASMRVDDDNWMLEIREKHSFTERTMDCYQSAGTYYFASGLLLKTYCDRMMKEGEPLNGEYYVSMVYDLMKKDNLKIYVFRIEKMLQRGTPVDLREYLYWSNLFRAKIHPQQTYDEIISQQMQTMIPIGGEGMRFKKEGYLDLKPLIKIGTTPMYVQAIRDMPHTKKIVFVCSNKHIQELSIDQNFKHYFPTSEIVSMDPQGPVQDCINAEHMFDPDKPLLIVPCDNGVMRNFSQFVDIYSDPKVDAAIRSFRRHPGLQLSPTSWGRIRVADDGATATEISCKVPISDNPTQDHAIVGAFYFKKAKYFFECAKEVISQNINVNGATHNDLVLGVMIDKGYAVRVFEVDKYIGRGTPNDFRSYLYRQEYFDQCIHHPYSRELDEDYTGELDAYIGLGGAQTLKNRFERITGSSQAR